VNFKRKGWRRDSLDHRDRRLSLARAQAPLPSRVDLSPRFPAVHDQLNCNSCVGNAVADLSQFVTGKPQGPSRLMIYYGARKLEGDPAADNGCEIRNGIKSLSRWAACTEADWPYDVSRVSLSPNANAYNHAAAIGDYAKLYFRLDQTLDQLRSMLAEGSPFVFGFSVFESFESDAVAASGVMPMPVPNEGITGGHAVAAVGYDDDQRMFIVRNSWGAGWGRSGYFLMPYAFIENPDYCDDFWVIKSIGRGAP